MNTTTTKLKATINDVTPKLKALLKEFTMVASHEMRSRSSGKDTLYIRMERPKTTIRCEA